MAFLPLPYMVPVKVLPLLIPQVDIVDTREGTLLVVYGVVTFLVYVQRTIADGHQGSPDVQSEDLHVGADIFFLSHNSLVFHMLNGCA